MSTPDFKRSAQQYVSLYRSTQIWNFVKRAILQAGKYSMPILPLRKWSWNRVKFHLHRIFSTTVIVNYRCIFSHEVNLIEPFHWVIHSCNNWNHHGYWPPVGNHRILAISASETIEVFYQFEPTYSSNSRVQIFCVFIGEPIHIKSQPKYKASAMLA